MPLLKFPSPVPAGAQEPGPTCSLSKPGGLEAAWSDCLGPGKASATPPFSGTLGAPELFPGKPRALVVGCSLLCGWQDPEGLPGPSLSQSRPGGVWRRRRVRVPTSPSPWMRVGVPLTSSPHLPPPAAQEARTKFEEAERSLRDMEESIRYGDVGVATAGQHLLLPSSPEEVVMESRQGNCCLQDREVVVAPEVPRRRGAELSPHTALYPGSQGLPALS